jgi:phosphatidate cytidylyltransferase
VIVPAAQPAKKERAGWGAPAGRSNLLLRVLTSLVLAPLAIAIAYWGGLAFHCFWSLAALVVLWEWNTLVCEHDRGPVLAIGAMALMTSSLLLAFGWAGTALGLVGLGLFGIATLATSIRRGWCVAGLVYAAALMWAPLVLRGDPVWGLSAILFLFTVVWLTDIAAYCVGRAAGGPKLLPRVSPNKTWSGAIGGALASVIGGVVMAKQFGIVNLMATGLVALFLSFASQIGDLLESAIKRQFGAKDASGLIPGHGGLMDRVDGFLTAAAAAALIGLARAGFDAPARGLMVW